MSSRSLPEWIDTTLGQFITLQRGIDLPTQDRRQGNIPILGSFGVTGWHDEARVKGLGITVERSGASFGTVSFTTEDYWPLNTALYVKDFHGNDPRFAYYFLTTFPFKLYNSGSAQPSLNRNFVQPVPITVPALTDQKRIAGVLGALDDKIELNRKMNKTLEAMAQAIFKSWFVDFEPFRDGGMVDSELGPIPKGWEISSFSEIIKIWSGGTPKRSNPDYWDGEIPWYTVKDAPAESDVWCINTSEKITPKGEQKSAAKVMRSGISIVSARGTVGKLALIGTPMAMNQSCYGIEGIDGYPDLFTYFMLKKIIDDLKARSHGSVFDTITRDTFGIVKIVKPTVKRAVEFENIVQLVIERIRNNCLETSSLAELRDTLLPKLLSGEIRVPEGESIGKEAWS